MSFPFSQILEQALSLSTDGYNEINLTGIDVASYNDEGDINSLGLLIKALLRELPGNIHFRLTSLDPAAIDESMYKVMENSRVLPHWHLSLQSGDDLILEKMKRRHRVKNVVDLCKKVKGIRKEMAIGADIIVGFPGETEEMFENTCNLVEKCGISLLHVFPYSDRPHTEAEKLKDKVTNAVKKTRARYLIQLGYKVLQNEMKNLIGKNTDVLIEKKDGSVFLGKTAQFFPVTMPAEGGISSSLISQNYKNFVKVKITDVNFSGEKPLLQGEMVE